MTPEDQTFINELRLRNSKDHPNPPTLDEMKRAIIILRCSRSSAAEAAAKSKGSRAKKAAPSEADIGDALADLDAM